VINEIVHLVLRRIVCKALKKLGQIFLTVKVVAKFGRVVKIPGGLV